jgi:hypothetical protein
MTFAADTASLTMRFLKAKERFYKRETKLHPNGDEFPLINHEDGTSVKHLTAARNKRSSVITRHKERKGTNFLRGFLVQRC